MCELEDPVLGRDKLCGFDEIINGPVKPVNNTTVQLSTFISMWSQEELDKIQKLMLSVDEGNQLLGLEILKQQEIPESFIPLLAFLSAAEEDKPNLQSDINQFFKEQQNENFAYWNEICSLFKKNHWPKNPEILKAFEAHSDIFDAIVLQTPRFSTSYHHLSKKIMVKKGMQDKRWMVYLQKAAEFNPNDYDANNSFAYNLPPENKEQILKHYAICLKIDNTLYSSYHNLGIAYFNCGDTVKALETFSEGLAKFQKAEQWILSYSIEVKGRDVSFGRSLLELVLKNDPENSTAHNNMAYLLWTKTKEFNLALEHAEKAIAINPKGIFWHTLAEVYYYGFADKTKAMEVLLMGKKADESYSDGDELIKVMESSDQ